MRRRPDGFTLVEAIVALTLTSLLVMLVATTFLVQNRYYAVQLARTTAQDNARARALYDKLATRTTWATYEMPCP